MSAFSPDWLRLREPFDHAARDEELVQWLADALPSRRPLRLVELGGGIGSGVRYVAPRLPGPQEWTVVDHDAELLAALPAAWRSRSHDLRDLSTLDLGADAVLCQALLDLGSVAFLSDLAEWVCRREVPLLASLTVDGRVEWHPEHELDGEVQSAFRLHQLGDRGFGPSPGFRAAEVMADQLCMRGYAVDLAPADWQIPPAEVQMLRRMVHGTAQAAAEVHPDPARVGEWKARRLDAIGAGLSLVVGHTDLLGLP